MLPRIGETKIRNAMVPEYLYKHQDSILLIPLKLMSIPVLPKQNGIWGGLPSSGSTHQIMTRPSRAVCWNVWPFRDSDKCVRVTYLSCPNVPFSVAAARHQIFATASTMAHSHVSRQELLLSHRGYLSRRTNRHSHLRNGQTFCSCWVAETPVTYFSPSTTKQITVSAGDDFNWVIPQFLAERLLDFIFCDVGWSPLSWPKKLAS